MGLALAATPHAGAEHPLSPPAPALPPHDALDAKAAAITEENLLASERFWPYYVALQTPWQPPGAERTLPRGSAGVLVRVEEAGLARVDFGRDGRYEVPIARTDLLDRANQVRVGEAEKLAPNFVMALGPRLVDSASASPRPLPFRQMAAHARFLCVFADPSDSKFKKLAASLAPLQEREDLLTILFPRGEHPDFKMRLTLRSLKWTVPFVYDHLSESYSRMLLSEDPPPVTILLQTGEGRVLFQREWRSDTASSLSSAIERVLGEDSDPTAATDEVARSQP